MKSTDGEDSSRLSAVSFLSHFCSLFESTLLPVFFTTPQAATAAKGSDERSRCIVSLSRETSSTFRLRLRRRPNNFSGVEGREGRVPRVRVREALGTIHKGRPH